MGTKITMSIDVSDEFLADILTTAVEGGINYWCHLSDIKRDDELRVLSFVAREMDNDGRPDPDEPAYPVSLRTAARGLERTLQDGFRLNPRIVTAISHGVIYIDAGYIDAEAADVILQAGLFNEVRYG